MLPALHSCHQKPVIPSLKIQLVFPINSQLHKPILVIQIRHPNVADIPFFHL